MFTPQKSWLFDLKLDQRESYDTSIWHTEKVDKLRSEYERMKDELANNKRGWTSNQAN